MKKLLFSVSCFLVLFFSSFSSAQTADTVCIRKDGKIFIAARIERLIASLKPNNVDLNTFSDKDLLILALEGETDIEVDSYTVLSFGPFFGFPIQQKEIKTFNHYIAKNGEINFAGSMKLDGQIKTNWSINTFMCIIPLSLLCFAFFSGRKGHVLSFVISALLASIPGFLFTGLIGKAVTLLSSDQDLAVAIVALVFGFLSVIGVAFMIGVSCSDFNRVFVAMMSCFLFYLLGFYFSAQLGRYDYSFLSAEYTVLYRYIGLYIGFGLLIYVLKSLSKEKKPKKSLAKA